MLAYRFEMDEDHSLHDIQRYGRVKGLAIGPVEMKLLSEVPDVQEDLYESSSTVISLCAAQPYAASQSPHASLLPKPCFPIASEYDPLR